MKTKDWIVNAFVSAIYIVLTYLSTIFGVGFGALQFRLSEILNHLGVFNKKYIVGIVAGVFLSNILLSPMALLDIIFGTTHTVIALVVMQWVTKRMKSDIRKMLVNAVSFAFFSFIIAAELYFAFGAPFWFSYFTVALGELVVMVIGAPIMKWLDNQVHFNRQISD